MTTRKRFFPLLLISAVCCLCLSAKAEQPQPTPPIIAAGSGVNLGITTVLATAYMAQHPDVTITIPGSIGTKGAISAIKDKAITIGLISRSLKENELSPDYRVVAYARTPIVIGAHPTVRDVGLSSDEVVAIFKGTKTQWSDGTEIIVQAREAFDSGFMELEKEISGFKTAVQESRNANRWSTYFTDQEANKALMGTRAAIGVTDLGMITTEKLNIKPLNLDGIPPSVETIQNRSYPLDRTLYLIYHEQSLPNAARAFIDFIFSHEGEAILKANGYLPL